MLSPASTKQSSALFVSLIFLTIILTTLVYFLQTSSIPFFTPSKPDTSSPPSSHQSEPSVPYSLNPQSPFSKPIVFSEHSNYENLSHVYDELWDELLPENGGFLKVISSDVDGEKRIGEEKGAAGEEVKKNKHKYGITMFHSLHCLGIMRGGVQELFREMEELKMKVGELEMGDMGRREKGGTEEGRTGKRAGEGHHFGHLEHGDPLHWLHCFDYLRQTILCTADGTLEPPKADSRGKENVDGMMERQCRDPEELWRLSVESFEKDE
ncbi:predicted protein [Sclerotinia sclerotiorum 1980 UF-70]|uniref:Uncharacterized protein n=2 Tax=Sclerotinia sclerotiorum (strain ATCC 18683 / 1980 / Ss-1) TaxID=665079 RepID=A0A1D9Q0V8_SCLS1|nr:predicted protein [Sclerotinia sclerotiorum 1980 UF-70]APA08442.1 hypothetical protein sscle_04g032120 [Sclerotinia sclerotiorum 1980 UF-70]EDN99274.1 predicted protein [Sclerotinia sclerotiorum 1980 UF-70]